MAKNATPIHEELQKSDELSEAEELKIKEAEQKAEADRVASDNAAELEKLEAEEEAQKKREAEQKKLAEEQAKKDKQTPKGKPKAKAKADNPTAPAFPIDTYYLEREEEINVSNDPEFPKWDIVKKLKLRREFADARHRIKCRIRAARHYDVTIDHLQSAYKQLNGKKIDGIFINFLIDRFGFSDGKQMNRVDTATKCGLPVGAVEVADEKLKNIIQKTFVLNEYKEYLKTFTDENTHETMRDSFNV